MPRINNIKVRRGQKQDWNSINPVLEQGELGFDTTNNLIKIGNGTDDWQNLSVLAIATPILLSLNADFTSKITVRSPIISFKETGDTSIFTVPSGYMFAIDSMEILTTEMSAPGAAPTVRFGTTSNYSEYYEESVTVSNGLGQRHIVENPQNAASQGTIVTFGITSASTASAHMGCGIITGCLIRIS